LRSLNTFREGGFGRPWLLRCAIAGLAALSFVVSASAVDPNRTVSQYLHNSWGTEKGWPGGSITAIAQTSDGYLWIGTDKGLVRFDGLNFHQFERAHPDPILIGPVRELLADANDNLWILLQNTQVFRYHNGNFELIRGEAENGTTAIARGTSGAVLLSSLAVGILTYTDNRFRTLSSVALLADAARVANGEAPDQRSTPFSWNYDMMPDRQPPLTSLVVAMAQTDDGKIWLGTERRGLFYLHEGRVLSASNERGDTKINCLLPLQNSELWVGTAKGVVRWNGTELTLAGVPPSLLNLDVLSILRDRDSNIWVGTSRGLFRYNANGVPSLGTREITGPISALFEDREGNIWIGSLHGLERLRGSAFVTYSLPNLKSQSMGPLHVDSGGRIWIAPIQGGLRWLKEGKSGVVTVDGIANDVVYSIAGIGKDDVWVGRQQGGLTHLHYSGNLFTAKTYTQADGLAQNTVYAVYVSRDGTVWSGTLNSGVSELKNGHFTDYTTTNGLAANAISSIVEGPDGTMWFGTSKGVSAMLQKGWRTYTANDGLPSEDVNCLLQDSTRILWIGTAEGLAYLSDGQVQVPHGVPALLQAPIFGIEEDKNGWLWIATSDRVLRVPRDKLLSGVVKAADVREYDQADGLESTEGVKRSRSVVSDSAGRVWFSLSSGMSVVDPSRVAASAALAIPHIEGLSVDGSPVNVQDMVHIPVSPRRITFTYTGLSLATPERVRFKYFLEGFDRSWSEPVATREAVYTNLGAHSYRFRVLASNSEGLWSESEAAVRFEVEPTVWQTWWFRTSSAALILLLAWCVYLYRLRQLAKEFNIRLEERVDERTRIARDLHDTLLQSFHGLLLRFQTASELFPTRPAEAKQALDSAIEQAAQAITEGRDAVQGLRSSTVVTNDLALAVNTLGEELAGGETNPNAAAFHVGVEGTPRDLHPILRDELYRIAGEALRNAFKHAQAHQIEVEIRYDERQFRLRVRDDGKGIDSKLLNDDERPGHYGMRGMRERAKLLGGKMTVWSELDSGTEVELSIPAANAYATPDGRRRSWLADKFAGKLAEKDMEGKS
jgi:ligand-binding sensor domain-containing protein/signal transduction histidine kinase